MSKTHIMLDLETLGTKPGCSILSIGAVPFTLEGPEMSEIPFHAFYVGVDIRTCYEAGLKMEMGTLQWWFQQSKGIEELIKLQKLPLQHALEKFLEWYVRVDGSYVWGHGATFDPPIITAALQAVRMEAPWHYTNVRDTRTVFHLAFGDDPRSVPFPQVGLVAHNALHDAWKQAVAVQRAVMKLQS